jgi:hypothetical protein
MLCYNQARYNNQKCMKKLYVIGNGFDLHHGLDTSYLSFGIFLKNSYPLIYENMTQYHGISDITNRRKSSGGYLWSELEFALADLDYETILEDYSDYLASPGSEDFRDRDWGAFQIEIEKVIDEITANLFNALHEFILSVKFPISVDCKLLGIDKDGVYLNFNYTDSLEKIYKIKRNNILYIHNQASVHDSVILGHGLNPKDLEPKKQEPPDDLSDEDYEKWAEMMSDSYDYSYELGKREVIKYFAKAHKNTSSIIKENEIFFLGLKDIKDVYVLGHSLSDIDVPYFGKIIDCVNDDANWIVTYFSEEEKLSHKETLAKCGVRNGMINLIKMNDLTLTKNNVSA